MAMPVIKRAAKAVGKQALKTGVSVLADVARGGDALPSLETHGREAVATLADQTLNYLNNKHPSTEQQGGGFAKRRRRSPTVSRKTSRGSRNKRKKPKPRSRRRLKRNRTKRKPIKGRRRKATKKGKQKRRRQRLQHPADIFDHVAG
jgi:hypothetical protein